MRHRDVPGQLHPVAALALVVFLALVNALLLVFNLIPAFPLDGGRIARAIAWKITGDRPRATQLSATLGQVFAYLLMAVGRVLARQRRRRSAACAGSCSACCSARRRAAAVAQTDFADRIDDVTAGDIMDAEPVAVPAPTAGRAGLRRVLPALPGLALVPGHRRGRPLRRPRPPAPRVEHAVAPRRTRRDARSRDGDRAAIGATVRRPTRRSSTLLGSEPLRRIGALFAVDGEGRLRGVVTVEQVCRAPCQSASSR